MESKKNKIANFESRNIKENLEWALKDHIFTKVKKQLGQLPFEQNNEVKRLCSFLS